MQTLTLILFLLGGIIALYLGAELLVIFAARLALSLGMTPIVVGLTVVAFSTSTPELASTLIAQLKGDRSNLALGTIVGSNIANIGFILGLLTLVKPLDVHKQIKTFEAPVMIGITALLWFFMLYHQINMWMGIILVGGICLYVFKHVISAKERENDEVKKEKSMYLSKRTLYSIYIALGVALLTVGGWLLVKGSVNLATRLGVSDRVIGLTVVAMGTSLPEFAASLVAIFRKLGDVAIGNILGSNIFNILFILGVVAIIRPIYFSPKFIYQDMPVLMLFSLLLWGLVILQKKLGRLSGLFLVLSYIGYLIWVA